MNDVTTPSLSEPLSTFDQYLNQLPKPNFNEPNDCAIEESMTEDAWLDRFVINNYFRKYNLGLVISILHDLKSEEDLILTATRVMDQA